MSMINIIERARWTAYRYLNKDNLLRKSFQDMVFEPRFIRGPGCVEMLNKLETALSDDNCVSLSKVLNDIASKYGVKAAMQTKISDDELGFFGRSGITNYEYEKSSANTTFQDWFSLAVQHKSVKCIAWAIKNDWAHPGQQIRSQGILVHLDPENNWKGEISTLRKLCWSGRLNEFDWVVSFKEKKDAWLRFNNGAYTDSKHPFLHRALEATVSPNEIFKGNLVIDASLLDNDMNRTAGWNLSKQIQGYRVTDKITKEAYDNFIKLNLCTEKDVLEFHQLMDNDFSWRGAYIPELISEMEKRMINRDIGGCNEDSSKASKNKVTAL